MTKPKQKRSISIHAHRTSIALEVEFWDVIDEAVEKDGRALAAFIAALDDERTQSDSPHGLAAYLRLYALEFVQIRHR
ncbi:MAG: ribbon-helix-helix domain-containing protein [Robiginitomaculum sp.]|nr:ribbon-helix-helix domain-containing protein [Robiginitomaculum sp.]